MTDASAPSGGTLAGEFIRRFGAGAAVLTRTVLAVELLRRARPTFPSVAALAREIGNAVNARPVIPARIRSAIVFIYFFFFFLI